MALHLFIEVYSHYNSFVVDLAYQTEEDTLPKLPISVQIVLLHD